MCLMYCIMIVNNCFTTNITSLPKYLKVETGYIVLDSWYCNRPLRLGDDYYKTMNYNNSYTFNLRFYAT